VGYVFTPDEMLGFTAVDVEIFKDGVSQTCYQMLKEELVPMKNVFNQSILKIT